MSSTDLKITIITVCLNSENYIEKTIQSVLTQTYPNIEYIVIDGNSSDNTLSIINKYRAEIDIIISEKDAGIYDAMNKGVSLSTGDIIYFLNSGDRLYNNTIVEQVVNIFIGKPEYSMVYGDLIFYSDKEEKYITNNRKGDLVDFLIHGTSHQSLFVRKKLFETVGLFNTNFTILADKDWLLRSIIGKRLPILYMGMPMSYFLAGGISCQYRNEYFFEDSRIIRDYLDHPIIKQSIRSNPLTFIRLLSIILFLELNKITIKIFNKNFAVYLKQVKDACCKMGGSSNHN
jgi:glycosyltransferase involved in cell wall biosynthesis